MMAGDPGLRDAIETAADALAQALELLPRPAPKERRGVMRGNREQITLTIAPDLLAKVDEIANRMGQSRAALINRAIYELAERVAA